jgi:hypothetical protein
MKGKLVGRGKHGIVLLSVSLVAQPQRGLTPHKQNLDRCTLRTFVIVMHVSAHIHSHTHAHTYTNKHVDTHIQHTLGALKPPACLHAQQPTCTVPVHPGRSALAGGP